MKNQLYETDFYAWTQQQSKFLLTGQWQDLDQENLGEEIAALGKQQRQELRNRFRHFDWTSFKMGLSTAIKGQKLESHHSGTTR